MIIIHDAERASVNTLVHPSDPPRYLENSGSRLTIPAFLPTFTFLSFAGSIAIFAFAVIWRSGPFRIQSIVATVTFSISLPLYLGAVIVLCTKKRLRWMPRKMFLIGFILILQALWVFFAIQAGMALALIWNRLVVCFGPVEMRYSPSDKQLKYPPTGCKRELAPQVAIAASIILAIIVVVVLGFVVKIVAKWDLGALINADANARGEESLSSISQSKTTSALRFVAPLAHASLGIAIQPLVVAVFQLSYSNLMVIAIATITACGLTILVHIAIILHQHQHQQHPSSTSTSSEQKSLKIPSFLFLTAALWLCTFGLGLERLTNSGFWQAMCGLADASNPTFSRCVGLVTTRLIACVFWAAIEICVLGVMVVMYVRHHSRTWGDEETSMVVPSITESEPSTPRLGQPVMKSPMLA
ncbi:hypothetical protein CVT24_008229 [Panaeolus cyanescens]|uniref:Uncharacterized protein n=1 Tax=Panaeolus cyanescens TaxID=181874 RepID=A0A409YR44_9AGAR|nr:hypothetical protein CVT24_008229 [Panaeolus cyanescens]